MTLEEILQTLRLAAKTLELLETDENYQRIESCYWFESPSNLTASDIAEVTNDLADYIAQKFSIIEHTTVFKANEND